MEKLALFCHSAAKSIFEKGKKYKKQRPKILCDNKKFPADLYKSYFVNSFSADNYRIKKSFGVNNSFKISKLLNITMFILKNTTIWTRKILQNS